MVCIFIFSMEITGGGSSIGDRSGSGSGSGLLDDQMREFIFSENTRGILEQTPVISGTIKEVIIQMLDDHLGTLHTEIVAMVGARSVTFREFHACEATEFFGKKEPIVSKRWLMDVVNALQTSIYYEGSKVRFASCKV